MKYIGSLDINKLGEYKDKLITKSVILTGERLQHIKKRHPGDYERYIEYIPLIINDPDYILKDKYNKDTILILKTLSDIDKNLQIVIKLQTIKNKNKSNSILTFWQMRNRSYNGIITNNEKIYKKVDKKE